MDRKEFLEKAGKVGICTSALLLLNQTGMPLSASEGKDDELERLKYERDFIINWLTDLRESIEINVDIKTKEKLFADCGIGCFKRHKFKTDLAKKGEGSIEKLLAAYQENFEAWIEGDKFHIRYGKINKSCYCTVGKNMPNRENDIHCECTKNTHKAIFETALKRPFKIDLLESVKRGGKTCHMVVHLKD
jgi:hypothetical protein